MGLRNLKIITTALEVAGGELEVRGLSVEDLTFMAARFGPEMAMLYTAITTKAEEAKQQGQDFDLQLAIISALKEAPELVSMCIACACDDTSPEAVAVARKLTIPDQVALIEAIFALTFRSESEVKKMLESVANAMVKLALTILEARLAASEAGIGDSDAV